MFDYCCRTRCILVNFSIGRQINLWSLNFPLLNTIPMLDLPSDSSINCHRLLTFRRWCPHSVHNAMHPKRNAKILEHLAVSSHCTCDVCWKRPISVRWVWHFVSYHSTCLWWVLQIRWRCASLSLRSIECLPLSWGSASILWCDSGTESPNSKSKCFQCFVVRIGLRCLRLHFCRKLSWPPAIWWMSPNQPEIGRLWDVSVSAVMRYGLHCFVTENEKRKEEKIRQISDECRSVGYAQSNHTRTRT